MSRTSDFIAWLAARRGAAYVWGAQGQEARSDGSVILDGKRVSASWESWVDARENSGENARRAKEYIRKRLEAGDGNVPCFDCSGLLMRYLKDVKGYFPEDKNAAGLLAACKEVARGALAPGHLLFRHNGKKAHHVGVYLGDGLAIEAQGRSAGVVIRPLDASGANYWNRFGALPFLAGDGAKAALGQARFAVCAGGSVNVRKGPGTEHAVLAVAHKGDPMLFLPSAEKDWGQVAVSSSGGLVTGYMHVKYIDCIEGGIEQ